MNDTYTRPYAIGSAVRVTATQAHDHYAAGGRLIVTERDNGSEIPVTSWSTTNDPARTSWTELEGTVKSYGVPTQTYYAVTYYPASPDDCGRACGRCDVCQAGA